MIVHANMVVSCRVVSCRERGDRLDGVLEGVLC